MVNGIETGDFTNFALADFGQTVVRNAVTKTVGNITGSRTLTYGSNTNITGIILRRNVIHKYLKEGEIEEGDAYLMLAHSNGVVRNDKITANGVVYRVGSVIERNPDGATSMFDMATLHKIG